MKDEIKNILKRFTSLNTYSNSFFYEKLTGKQTAEIERIVSNMTNENYLDGVDSLKEFTKDVRENHIDFFTRDANWSNAHIYGIWASVFGNTRKKLIETPCVEHGLIFHNEIFTDLRGTARMSCATFSDFRKEIIHKKMNIPVFTIGPYSHYVNPFFDDKQLRIYKRKFGKTLLVFPTHSTDSAELTVDQQRFLTYLQTKSTNFDTVLINAFWWNINDPLIETLEKEGYQIISCGFRDDPSFLRRLKAYLLISDEAMGDSIGTHIGYCLDCNVPFHYMTVDTKGKNLSSIEKKDTAFVESNVEQVKRVFAGSDIITAEQIEICNRYWGLNQVRTEEEISLIADINADILKYTKGFTLMRYSAAHRLISEYQKNGESLKAGLLQDAVS